MAMYVVEIFAFLVWTQSNDLSILPSTCYDKFIQSSILYIAGIQAWMC
jgi:hypothetical protein